MRAQQQSVAQIERIVHRARRMIGRDVQRLEVMKVILDLRPLGDLEARTPENLLDAQTRLRDRVQSAGALAPSGQRDIDGAGREPAVDRGALELVRAASRAWFAAAPWPH